MLGYVTITGFYLQYFLKVSNHLLFFKDADNVRRFYSNYFVWFNGYQFVLCLENCKVCSQPHVLNKSITNQ